MSTLDWLNNRLVGGHKTGVVTLEAGTPTGLSNEIAKYSQKGYVLQGGITTGTQYGGNTHKFYATMILADNSSQQSPESTALDDELKKIEIEKKRLELEEARLELENAKTPEQRKQEAEAKKKQAEDKERAKEQALTDKVEKGKAGLKLAGSVMLGPLGLVSSKNRENIKNSLNKLKKK